MGSNSFGTLFKITTFGESHGKAVGVVIDGCPAGLEISEREMAEALRKRAPGNSPHTSPRKEKDHPEIISGVFEGKTTGAPLCILIHNHDAKSAHYEEVKEILRPGHANFTYLGKYGLFDYRGGGRSSGRETAARVAAGFVAEKFLNHFGIQIEACLVDEKKMLLAIEKAKKEGDSIGGIVAFEIRGAPLGLGDPVYEKIESKLANAMLTIPATKGFEIGLGFESAFMKGSKYNDLYEKKGKKIKICSNHAGGLLGGITTGELIYGKVAFKPTSSIKKAQKSVTLRGKKTELKWHPEARHDPCIAVRGVLVVKAMCALVMADSLLMNRCAKL